MSKDLGNIDDVFYYFKYPITRLQNIIAIAWIAIRYGNMYGETYHVSFSKNMISTIKNTLQKAKKHSDATFELLKNEPPETRGSTELTDETAWVEAGCFCFKNPDELIDFLKSDPKFHELLKINKTVLE